jgi:hypothetical protein
MMRPHIYHIFLAALMAFVVQSLAAAQESSANPKVSPGQQSSEKASVKEPDGARKEIFCSAMKTGQLCPDDTAEILGLKGAQAEAWKAVLRKYNKSADDAAMQLQKDSAAKLTPEQMEVLKAWFAVGWNEQINKFLYKRNLDDLEKADTQGLSTRKEEGHSDH